MTDVLSNEDMGRHMEKSRPEAPAYWNAGRVSTAFSSRAVSSEE